MKTKKHQRTWNKKEFETSMDKTSYIQIAKDQGQQIDWEEISKYRFLSEIFLDTYRDELDWSLVSEHQQLSETFMDKYHELLDWDKIITHQILSESFIENYGGHNRALVACYQKLSETFLDTYIDYLSWGNEIYNKKTFSQLSLDFLRKNIDRVPVEKLFSIYSYDHIPQEIKNELISQSNRWLQLRKIFDDYTEDLIDYSGLKKEMVFGDMNITDAEWGWLLYDCDC
jgi:hypothetical protein